MSHKVTKTKFRKYKLPKQHFARRHTSTPAPVRWANRGLQNLRFQSDEHQMCRGNKLKLESSSFRGGTRQESSAGHASTPFTFHVNESQSDSLYRKRGHKESSRSFHKSLECSFRVATSPWAGKDVVTGSSPARLLNQTIEHLLYSTLLGTTNDCFRHKNSILVVTYLQVEDIRNIISAKYWEFITNLRWSSVSSWYKVSSVHCVDFSKFNTKSSTFGRSLDIII
jgi:hypothetical protein